MFNRFSTKMAPALMGVLSAWMLTGCGGEEVAQLEESVTVTKAATLNQHDFDTFLSGIKLSSCTFGIAAGTGTFTPSSELSQVLYGDPNGNAHKLTFPVPTISTPQATVDITSLDAEMANTGITLSGTTANVHLSFHGMLHVSVTVPIFGKLPADIQIKSSSIALNLGYDAVTERAKATSVVTKFDIKTQKCGGSGWCNGIVDSLLKTNLPTLIEGPLRDAVTKGLDSASATQGLDELLAAAYNVKDHAATPWTMVAHSLKLAASQFSFNAERTGP
jgi:hypothetical protein